MHETRSSSRRRILANAALNRLAPLCENPSAPSSAVDSRRQLRIMSDPFLTRTR
jgi:hypothetical protein